MMPEREMNAGEIVAVLFRLLDDANAKWDRNEQLESHTILALRSASDVAAKLSEALDAVADRGRP